MKCHHVGGKCCTLPAAEFTRPSIIRSHYTRPLHSQWGNHLLTVQHFIRAHLNHHVHGKSAHWQPVLTLPILEVLSIKQQPNLCLTRMHYACTENVFGICKFIRLYGLVECRLSFRWYRQSWERYLFFMVYLFIVIYPTCPAVTLHNPPEIDKSLLIVQGSFPVLLDVSRVLL